MDPLTKVGPVAKVELLGNVGPVDKGAAAPKCVKKEKQISLSLYIYIYIFLSITFF